MIIECTDAEIENLRNHYEPIKEGLWTPLTDRQLQDVQIWPQTNGGLLRILPGDLKWYIEGTPDEIANILEDHADQIRELS